MSKLGSTTIVYSGLSDTIYVARFGAKDPNLALDKIDRTSQFIRVLLEWCPPDTIRDIEYGGGVKYEISCVETTTMTDAKKIRERIAHHESRLEQLKKELENAK